MGNRAISRSLDDNITYIKKETGGDKTFDLLVRRFTVGEREAAIIFIDGFADAELLSRLMGHIMGLKREQVSVDIIRKLMHSFIPLMEVEVIEELDEGLDEVLAGPQLLLLDGDDRGIVLDARTWESRGPEEPELEKATRGPADGLGETLIFNIARIRRRLRDPKLRVEAFKIGSRSRTDVALMYIEDLARTELLASTREKLQKIDTDGLPLGDKTIEEFLTGNIWNPFPLIRYTERPDNVAAHLLEGHITIIVDTSPTAIIIPAPFLTQTQSLEDYRQGPVIGTYLTFLRFLSILVSVFLAPLWLVLVFNKEALPEALQFLGPKEETTIPLGFQFILASLGIDIIRLASLSTPNALATSLGLIGALFLGEFAVEVGLLAPEVILYVAAAAVTTFSIPGFELSLLMQILRLFLLVLVISLDWYGFVAGIVAIFVVMVCSRSFGVPYLWPLLPFNYNALRTFLTRPSILSLPPKRSSLAQKKSRKRTGG